MNHGNTLTLGTNLFPLKMANTFHAAPLALVGLCAAAVALVLELSVSRGSRMALVQQRKDVDAEMEFYQADPSKAPFWLRRKLEDSEKQTVVQKRFLEEQAQEKLRINQRFDEELAKLRQLWSPGSASGNGATLKR